MSCLAPLNTLFDVFNVKLIIEASPVLFLVRLLIAESFLLFPSVVLLPVLSVSIDSSWLVSAAPPVVAHGVVLLMFIIVADNPISDSDWTIPGLFLPFRINIL